MKKFIPSTLLKRVQTHLFDDLSRCDSLHIHLMFSYTLLCPVSQCPCPVSTPWRWRTWSMLYSCCTQHSTCLNTTCCRRGSCWRDWTSSSRSCHLWKRCAGIQMLLHLSQHPFIFSVLFWKTEDIDVLLVYWCNTSLLMLLLYRWRPSCTAQPSSTQPGLCGPVWPCCLCRVVLWPGSPGGSIHGTSWSPSLTSSPTPPAWEPSPIMSLQSRQV